MKGTNLLEWCVHYVKARDSIERKLKSIDERSDRLICHYKDRVVTFLPEELLTSAATKIDGAVTVVCLNSKKNFDTLLELFPELAKHSQLMIIFVNPEANEKWMIKPAVHHAVADKSSLKLGLQAMFDTVPIV